MPRLTLKKNFEKLFYNVYKMPPDPHPPFGNPDSVRIFRASPKLYYVNLFKWFVKQFFATLAFFYFLIWTRRFALVERYLPPEVVEVLESFVPLSTGFNAFYGTMFGILESFSPVPLPDNTFMWFELIAMASFLLQLPFSYAYVLIDYKMRWYIVTDRSLRIRAGVNRIRELTMTYANIQNISIQQNIVQQFLGIADLKVQTAGGASGEGGDADNAEDKSIHVAYFKGVESVAEIRDLILNRLNQQLQLTTTSPSRTEDEHISQVEVALTPNTIVVNANDLLAEAQSLRKAVKTK